MNPLSFLPYALAAGKGRIDGIAAAAWAAAGFTLLQRSAPLVRALAGKRTAILLPPAGAVVTALAASDGHGAVLLDSVTPADETAWLLDKHDVGAVFTTRALTTNLPANGRALVLLDDAPRSATVIAKGTETRIDLGSHFGLELEGEEDDGSLDECLISTVGGGVTFSHRAVFALARGAVDATSIIERDQVLATQPITSLAEFALTIAGPLLAGASVRTLSAFDAASALRRLRDDQVTLFAGNATMFAAMLTELDAMSDAPFTAPTLRVCTCVGPRPDAALQERWLAATGVELRHAFGAPEAPLALFNAPHFPNRRGTLGVPFPGMRAEVRDAAGAVVAAGVAGSLFVRGAQCADAWVNTGVTARERADGAFDITE